jgi:pimeloyl-ACP methyl ester carboxylesterase
MCKPSFSFAMACCRALSAASLLAIAACDHGPTAVSESAWTGERHLTTPAGTRILARIDRSSAAPSSPVIVLMSGLDTPLELWTAVRSTLATSATVFSYDRGGVGRSSPVTGPRPSSVVAQELHDALRAAGLRPPYLLVAHSIGGLHARVFADRYRTEVAGLVLVDATHETLLGFLGPDDITAIADAQQFAGSKAEVLAQAQSVAEAVSSRLPDVPLSVITSMKPEPGQSADVREWFANLQAQWLELVSRSEQVRTDVGHLVPVEAPGVVVDATQRVLALGRTARRVDGDTEFPVGPLPPCPLSPPSSARPPVERQFMCRSSAPLSGSNGCFPFSARLGVSSDISGRSANGPC